MVFQSFLSKRRELFAKREGTGYSGSPPRACSGRGKRPCCRDCFVYHYGGGARSSFLPVRTIGYLIHFGSAGVSLFFVLSGFLISGILWDGYKHRDWWKRFYTRRSLRIFPLYYLALLFAATVWLLSGVAPGTISPLILYALYLGDIPALGRYFSHLPVSVTLGHFWSLAVEEQFYIFWPFVLAIFAGRRRRAIHLILALWVCSLAFRIALVAMHASFEWQGEFLFSRAGELLAGAYLAMVVRGDAEERQSVFRWMPAAMVSSLVLIAIAAYVTGAAGFNQPLMLTAGLALCSVLFTCVVGLSLQPGMIQSFFVSPVLRWLGKVSYGIYVYHLLLRGGFAWITDRIAPRANYNERLVLLFFVALAGTLVVASLSFYTYESAFLRLKDRLGRSANQPDPQKQKAHSG